MTPPSPTPGTLPGRLPARRQHEQPTAAMHQQHAAGDGTATLGYGIATGARNFSHLGPGRADRAGGSPT